MKTYTINVVCAPELYMPPPPPVSPLPDVPWQLTVRSRYCVVALLMRHYTTDGQLLDEAEEDEEAPYVCPGCYAVGEERCAPGCIDDELARDREYWRNSDREDDEDSE